MQKHQRKMLYLEWYDPTSDDAWKEIDKLENDCPHTIKSIGWLIKESKEAIRIALSVDDSDESLCASSMIIPKSLISLRKELKIKGTR